MADPLSIVAVLGLAFVAKNLSEKKPELPTRVIASAPAAQQQSPMYDANLVPPSATFQGLFEQRKKEKYVQPSFGDISPDVNFTTGMPVQDFSERMWVSGQMNNLAPSDKIMVGPGLGVGPDVPSIGGYQQVFRVLPNNVGAYRLTTLPGRAGPANGTITGGQAPVWGAVANNRPEKTAFLPIRHGPMPSRAQGQGGENTGATGRQDYQRTKRPTNRAETSLRSDGLSFAPAKRMVSAGTMSQDPTRNKTDFTTMQFDHLDNPQPGIANFKGAYTNPSNELRTADKRGNSGRAGPAGGMNVMLSKPGHLTAVRVDSYAANRIPSRDGGHTQQYMPLGYQENNSYKGMRNPLSSSKNLDIALCNNKLMCRLAVILLGTAPSVWHKPISGFFSILVNL